MGSYSYIFLGPSSFILFSFWFYSIRKIKLPTYFYCLRKKTIHMEKDRSVNKSHVNDSSLFFGAKIYFSWLSEQKSIAQKKLSDFCSHFSRFALTFINQNLFIVDWCSKKSTFSVLSFSIDFFFEILFILNRCSKRKHLQFSISFK